MHNVMEIIPEFIQYNPEPTENMRIYQHLKNQQKCKQKTRNEKENNKKTTRKQPKIKFQGIKQKSLQ